MSRNQAFRLAGELELQALQRRIGYRDSTVTPSPQAQYGRRGEMIDTRPLERDIQKAVFKALELHPLIAFAWRANAGGFINSAGTYVKMNFTGCSDLLFVLVGGGRFGACEVKRLGEKPTPEQQSFLDNVNRSGGLGFVARCVDDVYAAIPLRKGVE